MEEQEAYRKVLFRYFSPVLKEEIVETMWAIVIDEVKGLYRLDNIPFYGPQIATEDEFFAELDLDDAEITRLYAHTDRYLDAAGHDLAPGHRREHGQLVGEWCQGGQHAGPTHDESVAGFFHHPQANIGIEFGYLLGSIDLRIQERMRQT